MKVRALVVAVAIAAVATPCYNDSDTNLTELRDNLDITYAIAGRFTIYPPEYYKRRIEIQTANLKKNPNDLNAYDNLAVAYDRLGKHDEAIATIRKERALLNKPGVNPLTEVKDELVTDALPVNHRYTVEANEGTFLIHRWIAIGGNSDLSDAIEAEKHIAKAIEINPNAHFGREFAQLYCMRAILKGAKEGDWKRNFTENLIAIADRDKVDHKALRKGIAGMMVLGNAWNSPVMLEAIMGLVPQDMQVKTLCWLRIGEIQIRQEDRAADVTYSKIANGLRNEWFRPYRMEMDIKVLGEIRENAVRYANNANSFILKRLTEGKHPDADKDFWDGYVPVAAVSRDRYELPDTTHPERHLKPLFTGVAAVAISLVVVIIVWRIRSSVIRHRPH